MFANICTMPISVPIMPNAGAQSPKETWLRLVLVQAGLPRPRTQIPVCDEFGQAKHVMLQIHDVLAAYPGMAAHIAQNVPEFASERLTSLITDPLQAAGLSADEAARIVFTLILLNAGHMLIRVPAGLEDEAAAAFAEGVDLILRGAQTRSQHRSVNTVD